MEYYSVDTDTQSRHSHFWMATDLSGALVALWLDHASCSLAHNLGTQICRPYCFVYIHTDKLHTYAHTHTHTHTRIQSFTLAMEDKLSSFIGFIFPCSEKGDLMTNHYTGVFLLTSLSSIQCVFLWSLTFCNCISFWIRDELSPHISHMKNCNPTFPLMKSCLPRQLECMEY